MIMQYGCVATQVEADTCHRNFTDHHRRREAAWKLEVNCANSSYSQNTALRVVKTEGTASSNVAPSRARHQIAAQTVKDLQKSTGDDSCANPSTDKRRHLAVMLLKAQAELTRTKVGTLIASIGKCIARLYMLKAASE